MTDYEQIKQMCEEINSSDGLAKEMLKVIEDSLSFLSIQTRVIFYLLRGDTDENK